MTDTTTSITANKDSTRSSTPTVDAIEDAFIAFLERASSPPRWIKEVEVITDAVEPVLLRKEQVVDD